MIVGADSVDGQHGRGRAQPKLVRKAGFLEGASKVLLRQRTGDQAPENVANDQCPHTAIGFAQRNHAPKAPSLEDLLWHVCVSQALGSSAEQCAVRRVI